MAVDDPEKVTRIVVLRGGGIGDALFCVPALEALAARFRGARVVLLTQPGPAALLSGRLRVDVEVRPLPHLPGINDGPGEGDPGEFAARLREERFDLAAQLHGGGRNSNPFVASFGARFAIGLRTPDAPKLDATVPYLYYQHEVVRYLEVVGLVGARPVTLEPSLRPLPSDLDAAGRFRTGAGPLVVIHPGATDPRRRWPADRFGAVAERLAAAGARVVVAATEGGLADEVARAARGIRRDADVTDAGPLTPAELVGLLASADLLVGNDSGPRHLAGALGTPTASVYWVGNVINSSPLTRARHRLRMSWTVNCPVCGRDVTQVGWTSERCEHDDSFVTDVPVEAVLEDARTLLDPAATASSAPPRGR